MNSTFQGSCLKVGPFCWWRFLRRKSQALVLFWRSQWAGSMRRLEFGLNGIGIGRVSVIQLFWRSERRSSSGTWWIVGETLEWCGALTCMTTHSECHFTADKSRSMGAIITRLKCEMIAGYSGYYLAWCLKVFPAVSQILSVRLAGFRVCFDISSP